MDIRPYSPLDRDACLAIAASLPEESHTPQFEQFLDTAPAADFFVAEHDGKILACGGYTRDPDGAVWLNWGMVHRDWQRNGIGKLLLFYRLREIAKLNAAFVWVAPPPDAAAFYEKFGFRADGTSMVKRLEVCG